MIVVGWKEVVNLMYLHGRSICIVIRFIEV
jgi:hypothetical protein